MTAPTSPPPELAAPDDDAADAPPPTVARALDADDDGERDAPRGLATALLLVLLIAVAIVVGPTIAALERPGPDELYYLSYGKTLVERGPGAFPDLFRTQIEDPRHWHFPKPLRVAHLAIAALWMKLDGVALQSLAHLSLVSHLLAIVVVFRLARARLGETRALAGAVLFASSPLLLGMSRRALQDSTATLAALVALAALLAAIERPNRARAALFAAAISLAILTKESLLLLIVPMALWVALERHGRRLAGAAALRLLVASAGALAIVAAVWIVAAGGARTAFRLIEITLAEPATNEYALRFGGGGWWRYLVDFLALSPLPTLLGIAGLALTLERTRHGAISERGERLLPFLALLASVTVLEYALLTKNVRYVALLELPLRLFAIEALWRLVPARSSALRVALVGAAVLGLAVLDIASFRELFVAKGLYDPMSAPLLELRGVVPGR